MIYQTQTIIDINSLIEKRNSLLPLKEKDEKRLQKKYRLEFNYNSNHLEGNTLTYGQTELLLLFDKSTGDVKLSDLEEMKAHDVALSLIKDMAKEKERPLTEQFIKELNKTILVRPFWKEAITADGIAARKKIEIGSYKNTPNSVRLRNGEIHEYASPEETPAKMNDLMDWYQKNINIMQPVQLAAEFHYRFVCIHPFDDGNGRVARLIMNYILLRFDYPLVIIKSKDKEAYLTALQKADVGDILAIIEYIEKQMLWSIDLEIKAANGEDLEEDDDIDKEIALLKREKLQNIVVRKNTQIINDLMIGFHTSIWPLIFDSINKFDDFFTANETTIICNYLKKNDTTQEIDISSRFIDTWPRGISKLKISQNETFNFERINSVSWKQKLITLKSIKQKLDITVFTTIKFNETNYNLKVKCIESKKYHKVWEGIVYSNNINYETQIDKLSLKELKKDVSKKILAIINEY